MHSKKLLWLVPLFAMAACGNGRRNTEDYADKSVTVRADSTEAAAGKMPPAGNATAAPPLNSPDRKIKRTAVRAIGKSKWRRGTGKPDTKQ